MELGNLDYDSNESLDCVRIVNRLLSSNSYICRTSTKGECFLVDPGLDPELIDEYLVKNGLKPSFIFCTHGHFDHLGGVKFFQDKYGARACVHSADLKIAKASNFLMMACKIDRRIVVPSFELLAEDGLEIEFGSDTVRYWSTPGHTPGSCFVTYKDVVFTGDTLYRSAIGLVDLPGEDQEQLKGSILKIWDLIPDDRIICPGHGGSDSFGNIKKNNLALRSFLGSALKG